MTALVALGQGITGAGSGAAARGEFGVWGEPTRGSSKEFTPIEPSLIAWAISRAVGLGPRSEP
ncbi:MAG: hypothetical protein WBQ14_11530, partial [Gaiellaceae bacterium]